MPLVVAPLAAVILALVALLLIYAFYQIFHPLLQGLGQAGGTVGGFLARAADAVLSDAYSFAMSWAHRAVHDIVGFILAPVYWVEQHIRALTDTLAAVMFVQQWTNSVFVPRQITGALGIANGWVHQAEQLASSEFAAADSYALTLYHDAIDFTSAGLARVTGYAQTLYQDSVGFTEAQIAATDRYALSLYHDAVTFTQSAVAGAEAYTTASLTGVENWVTGQVTALDRYIATVLPAAYAYTNTAVATVEADLTRLKVDCTDNLCTNLGSLANLFNALSGAVSATLFIEMIGEVMRDPHGAAAALDRAVGAPARAVAGTVLGAL